MTTVFYPRIEEIDTDALIVNDGAMELAPIDEAPLQVGAFDISETTPARLSNPFTQRGFGTLLKTEAKIWLRSPGTWFFAMLLPTLIIVVNGLLSPTFATQPMDLPGSMFDGITGLQAMLPAFLAMGIATPFLTIIPAEFGGFREKGILKRFSGSPMSPQSLIAAHYLINLAAAIIGAGLALLISAIMWPMTFPANLAIVLLGFILGTTAMAALGTLIAARVAKASTGNALGSAVYFPLLIMSGVIGGGTQTNAVFRNIARISPLGAATQIMEQGWHGYGFPTFEVLVLLAWTIVFTLLGVKLFRWR